MIFHQIKTPHHPQHESSSDYTATVTTETIMANPIKRLAALVYDSMLVFAVLFTATLIPSLILGKADGSGIANETVVHELHPLLTGLPFQLYLLVVVIGFYSWFWLRNGQTLGMRAWRIQLQDISGAPVTLKQCLIRFFGAIISFAAAGLGYWWVWIDKDNMAWHDRWSKTRVVLLPKK